MIVKLLSWTRRPELVCVASMRSTRTLESAATLIEEGFDLERVAKMIETAKKLKHWGVFEHAVFTVSVEGVSRALTHQLVRHRVASYLQQSQRAVKIDTKSEWYVIPHTIANNPEALATFRAGREFEAEEYNIHVAAGIPEEDARFVLPNACKTNIVITMNARSWLHFFKLRLDSHAQWEIREMAKAIFNILYGVSPMIFAGAEELDV